MKTSEGVDAIDRVLHEPSRMAILSALCAARAGVPFTELRDGCGLTDGNLSRHLKTLEEEGVVRCTKAFVEGKPRTTVTLTASGLKRFQAYLDTLSEVLKQARSAARREPAPAPLSLGRLATT
jgi:DNA-binding transcriptional ArsR family regulator